jgi:hypothetical protein
MNFYFTQLLNKLICDDEFARKRCKREKKSGKVRQKSGKQETEERLKG